MHKNILLKGVHYQKHLEIINLEDMHSLNISSMRLTSIIRNMLKDFIKKYKYNF